VQVAFAPQGGVAAAHSSMSSQTSPSPSKPGLQAQSYEPAEFVQVAKAPHGGVAAWHSSMSSHAKPLPAKPGRQAHSNEPVRFVHVASASHGPGSASLHSSRSEQVTPSPT